MRRWSLALLALVPARTLAGKCDDVLPFTQTELVLPEVSLVRGDQSAAAPFFPDGVLLSDWREGTLDSLFLDDGVTLEFER